MVLCVVQPDLWLQVQVEQPGLLGLVLWAVQPDLWLQGQVEQP